MTETQAGPAWALGHELEELRAIARLFAQHDGELPRSPFSRFRERDVAQALSNGESWLHGSADAPDAAAFGAVVRQNRIVRDFAGEPIGRQEPGDLFIRRLAWLGSDGFAFVDRLLADLEAEYEKRGAIVWVEIWQEHIGERVLLDAPHVGREWLWHGTKIRASSELRGIWAHRRREWFRERPFDSASLRRLGCEIPEGMLLEAEEALAELPAFADHYSSYNVRHSWSAMALRGFAPPGDFADPLFIEKPAEMSKAWKAANAEKLEWLPAWSPIAAHFPELRELAEQIPGEKERVRLMRLEPGGGELTRHSDITDPDAGTRSGKQLRIHIPIITNPGVRFRMWELDGSLSAASMARGEAWYLDTRKPHTAKNGGESVRIHLVMDVRSNSSLLDLLASGAPADRIAEPGEVLA